MSTSNIKKSKRQSLVALLLIAALAITGVFAFLTATTDTKENKFTVGNISIDVDEGPWDDALTEDADKDGNPDGDGDPANNIPANGIPDYAENIVSGKIMEKAPKIINDGTNEAWAYVLVSIPKEADVVVADDTGVTSAPAAVELFKLLTENEDGTYTTGYNTADWVELEGAAYETDGFVNYVYAYKNKVAAGTETSTLFDAVRFANVTEAFAGAANKQLVVKVTGLAIQDDTSFADDYRAAWNALIADNSISDYPVNTITAETTTDEATTVEESANA